MSPRKCKIEAQACAQGQKKEKKIKEKPEAKQSKRSGDLRARRHPAKLVKMNGRRP